jgi:hypothetical protein
MRLNVVRTIESLLFIGLLMPAGMLFGVQTNQPPAVTSSSANWAYSEEASNLLNEMQGLAQKVTVAISPLQVQEYQLAWRAQVSMLSSARADINKMGEDFVRLDEIKKGLEPWQQTLVDRITPRVHELVYQADAAIAKVSKYQSKTRLAMTEYPQNINMIYKNVNQMAGTIGTVTQYARAEEKMAALEQHTAKAGS